MTVQTTLNYAENNATAGNENFENFNERKSVPDFGSQNYSY